MTAPSSKPYSAARRARAAAAASALTGSTCGAAAGRKRASSAPRSFARSTRSVLAPRTRSAPRASIVSTRVSTFARRPCPLARLWRLRTKRGRVRRVRSVSRVMSPARNPWAWTPDQGGVADADAGAEFEAGEADTGQQGEAEVLVGGGGADDPDLVTGRGHVPGQGPDVGADSPGGGAEYVDDPHDSSSLSSR